METPLDVFRFSLDRPTADESTATSAAASAVVIKSLLHSCVLIQEETFPRIFSAIKIAEKNLGADFSKTRFFVCPSSEQNAFSFRAEGGAIIGLNSALIERFSTEELAFVIGHETAHVLFSHTPYERLPEGETYATLRRNTISRAAEISADRLGFLACRNINASTAAIIKLATGLTEKEVRFSVNYFLRQFDELLKRGISENEQRSSHPMFLLRLRALIAFSGCNEVSTFLKQPANARRTLADVDLGVAKDFQKISGVDFPRLSSSFLEQTKLCAAFSVFAVDNKFSKSEQLFLKTNFNGEGSAHFIKIIKQKGMSGILFELEKMLHSLVSDGYSRAEQRDVLDFLSRLENEFPAEETKAMRSIKNKFFSF